MIGSLLDREEETAGCDLVLMDRVEAVEMKSSLSFKLGTGSFLFLCLFSLDIPIFINPLSERMNSNTKIQKSKSNLGKEQFGQKIHSKSQFRI